VGHIVVIIAVEDQQISRNVQCVAVCCRGQTIVPQRALQSSHSPKARFATGRGERKRTIGRPEVN